MHIPCRRGGEGLFSSRIEPVVTISPCRVYLSPSYCRFLLALPLLGQSSSLWQAVPSYQSFVPLQGSFDLSCKCLRHSSDGLRGSAPPVTLLSFVSWRCPYPSEQTALCSRGLQVTLGVRLFVLPVGLVHRPVAQTLQDLL